MSDLSTNQAKPVLLRVESSMLFVGISLLCIWACTSNSTTWSRFQPTKSVKPPILFQPVLEQQAPSTTGAPSNTTIYDFVTTQRTGSSSRGTRVAFITALTSRIEKKLRPFSVSANHNDSNVSFIVFTDFTPHSVGDRYQRWKFYPLVYHLPYASDTSYDNSLGNNPTPFNIAKWYKLQWHKIPFLVRDYDVVVWIDATIEVHNASCAREVLRLVVEEGHAIVTWLHHFRNGTLRNEVEV
eukprot:PhF_6_TR8293/c0_g2_i1/m.12754